MNEALIIGLIAFVIVLIISKVFKTDIISTIMFLFLFGWIGIPLLQKVGEMLIPWLQSLGL